MKPFFIAFALLFMGVQLMAQTAEVVNCQNRKYTLIGKQSLETNSQTSSDYMYYGYKNDTIVVTITSYDKEKVLRSVFVQKMALSDFASSSYTDNQGNIYYKKGTYNISWASDSSYCKVSLNIGTREKKAIYIADTGCTYATMRPLVSNENQVYVRFPNAAKAEAFLAELQAKSKKFEKK